MKGYTTDKELMCKDMAKYSGEMNHRFGIGSGPYEPCIVEIAKLKVRTPDKDIINISESPHYQYAIGNKDVYIDFLHEFYHQWAPFDIQLKSFDYLLSDEKNYLDPPHDQDFILCGQDLVIADGVHRTTCLVLLGVKFAPILK